MHTNPYKIIKSVLFCIDIFVVTAFSLIILKMVYEKKHDEFGSVLLPICLSVPILTVVNIILITYYRKVVKCVEFEKENVIVHTYHKKYILPNRYFTEVREDLGIKRTIIKYYDGNKKMIFIFHMLHYSPFKIYRINIEEMKKHMPYTKFI